MGDVVSFERYRRSLGKPKRHPPVNSFESELDTITIMIGHHTLDPDRPFSGYPNTISGIRGARDVDGLCVRDIADCLAIALVKEYPEGAPGQADLAAALADGTLTWEELNFLHMPLINPVSLLHTLGETVIETLKQRKAEQQRNEELLQ